MWHTAVTCSAYYYHFSSALADTGLAILLEEGWHCQIGRNKSDGNQLLIFSVFVSTRCKMAHRKIVCNTYSFLFVQVTKSSDSHSGSCSGMSITSTQSAANGAKAIAGELNGPPISTNGIVMNSGTSSASVNGNGQLGASAMFNLAKIASSEQKSQPSSVSTVTGPTTAVMGAPSHSVVCTGSVPVTLAPSQQAMSGAASNTQPRPTLAQPINPSPRLTAAMPSSVIMPRPPVRNCFRFSYVLFITCI